MTFNSQPDRCPRDALIALIKDILDDEHGKDFVEIAVSLYAAQLIEMESDCAAPTNSRR
jgi:hypothetical protein